MQKSNLTAALVTGAALFTAAGSAMATPPAIDVSAAVDAVGDMATPIGALGLASLLIVVAIKTWKYLRRGV